MSSPPAEPVQPATTEVCVYLMDKNGICMQFDRPQSEVTTAQILTRLGDCLHRQVDSVDAVDAPNAAPADQPKPIPAPESLFSLWMCSPLLELQLKPQHRPFNLLCSWDELLRRFASLDVVANADKIADDTPILTYQRNVFASCASEEALQEPLALKLLFEEASERLLAGRYPVPLEDACQLAALYLRIEEQRVYLPELHTPAYLLQRLDTLLPAALLSAGKLDFGLHRSRLAAKILQLFKQLPLELTRSDLHRNYLRIVRESPVYGAAFFDSQIERPTTGLASLVSHYDVRIWMAINSNGLHLVDRKQSKLLLSLAHGLFSWEVALPAKQSELNPNRLACVFVQVRTDEKRAQLMQIFTRQALLIESLLKQFASLQASADLVDSRSISSASSFLTSHSLNLKRLCCAKFNEKGECIKKRGSFNYVKEAKTAA